MPIKRFISRYYKTAVTIVVYITVMAGCATYREPDIDEDLVVEIKGNTGAMIHLEDGKKSLKERERDYKAYVDVYVAPGILCIAVDVAPLFPVIPPYEYRTCPICFYVSPAEVYKISTHWEFRWPEIYAPVYVQIVKESTGQVVAIQHEFCSKFLIPIYYNPNLY
jgi:hypothetical protein